MEHFSDATRAWFGENFSAPTEVQRRGWAAIARGEHALLVAPTGSGKTLAAFLAALDGLLRREAEPVPGTRVLYVSPLKALVYDIERNLRAPLAGIRRAAQRLGSDARELRVDVRTGDTPARERRRQARAPGEILVTTPESLFLILSSRARESLVGVDTVIVDEVHALAPTKRGVHLALSLERIAELTNTDPRRIGLSATLRPLDEAAGFLGGTRPVTVVDASSPPRLDLEVVVPVPDMENMGGSRRGDSGENAAWAGAAAEDGAGEAAVGRRRGGSILGALYAREVGTPPRERGIWPAIYPALLEEIRAHRSTIIFVNSRGLCERLSQRLNELAGEELVLAHHGSVSNEKRAQIEDRLKAGRVPALVATSSLELGVDMGAVDRVILVESPGSVARGLQRVGRAGHRVDEVSAGRIVPKFRGDLLECAVIAQRMREGAIEGMRVPRNPLDVLAQHVVAMCCDEPRDVQALGRAVRASFPYRDLSAGALEAVLDMLSGHYPSDEFADLQPRLAWDRAQDRLSARRGAATLVRLNAGTIPDRGSYAVHLGPEGPRLGELDEEMVFETRTGDNIILGASTWRVMEITRDRVIVSPAPGEPGRLPFWRGDGPGRPLELGRALGAFTRRIGALSRDEATEYLLTHAPLGRFAAQNLAGYVFEQKAHTGTLPTDRGITVERFRDELGDWRVCILSPFGARVHAPWGMALQRLLGQRSGFEIQLMYTDDGIVLRFADVDELPGLEQLIPDPEEVEDLVTEQLAASSLFAALFRENAARALLLPRRRPGRRSPLWAQRQRAQSLLGVVRRYPAFPIVLETYRQALSDAFDLPALKSLLQDIRSRTIRVDDVQTASASPFARTLVFAYVAAYIYEQDAPLAERKAHALTLDRGLLSELLGQAELRELIDPGVLESLEAELQRLTEERRARDADELHDVLRRLGDLTPQETRARSAGPADGWLEALRAQRRAVAVTVAGGSRWIAAEDAGLYRDALGVMPPPGLPDAFLHPVAAPLERLARRYARTHGPFLTREVATRYGLRAAQTEPVLRTLETNGVLVRGEIRPGGSELEWCDREVLQRLKRGTLAKLRNEVAPVDAGALGRFLPAWHGVRPRRAGRDALEEAIAQLEGLSLPWSALDGILLPERVPDYGPQRLDMLSASGAVVWVGQAALGAADGRIALYRRERAPLLLSDEREEAPPSPVHETLLEHLRRNGACFFFELERAVAAGHPETSARELEAALWDLVWAGRITNDTFQPLRALGRRRHGGGRAGRARREGITAGRWSLVSQLVDAAATGEARTLARVDMLLERYGVVSREAAQAEELAGGFAPLYQALKVMEEAGRVRRGYFVEGLSGAQFGHAGAVDRLRAARTEKADDEPYDDDDALVLATLDPANPYGALLPWPPNGAGEAVRPRRVPGAWIVLVDGRLVLYVGPGARHLLTFPEACTGRNELRVAFRALHRLPRGRRRGLLVVHKVDGRSAADSPQYALLRECGFAEDYRGLTAATYAS